MIEILRKSNEHGDTEQLTIVLAPDRSLDWEGNKRVIWSLGGVCMGIAVGFTLVAGTWVMLPFAGIEVLALTSALYYVSWKLSYRQVLKVGRDSLQLEKGVYRPRSGWRWSTDDIRLLAEPPKHDWEAPILTITGGADGDVTIGEFLNSADADTLMQALAGWVQVERRGL